MLHIIIIIIIKFHIMPDSCCKDYYREENTRLLHWFRHLSKKQLLAITLLYYYTIAFNAKYKINNINNITILYCTRTVLYCTRTVLYCTRTCTVLHSYRTVLHSYLHWTALVPYYTALVPYYTALVPYSTALVPYYTALVPYYTALVPHIDSKTLRKQINFKTIYR